MKNRNNIFKTIALIAAVFVLIYVVIILSVKINEQRENIVALKDMLDEQNEKVAKLRYELDRPIDDEYIIEKAREKLNFHLPSEIIFYNGRSE